MIEILTATFPWAMLALMAYLFTRLIFRQMKVIESLVARAPLTYNHVTPSYGEYPVPEPDDSEILDAFDEIG